MLVRQKLSDDWTVQIGRTTASKLAAWSRPRVEGRLLRMQHTTNPAPHSANVLPTRWSKVIDAISSDVVNLHWIGAGTLSIEDVGRIRQPVVMTLHDMWGFCGAEHYAPDVEEARWRTGYRRDNQTAGLGGLDIDRWTWQRKRKRWRPVPVICPSRWLAECARRSALMAEWQMHVIPNTLDVSVFRPLDKMLARRMLNLPQEGSLVLFGAIGGESDPRKGFDLLMEALGMLGCGSASIAGVVYGRSEPKDPPRTGVPLHWMGRVRDDTTLGLLYNAVDLMVVPSRQEAFGQTGSEAQACGTPVVAFNATGLRDVVAHQETGYLAEPFSTTDLARGISWVLSNETRRASLGGAARERAVRLWKPSSVADRYVTVYQEAIEATRRSG